MAEFLCCCGGIGVKGCRIDVLRRRGKLPATSANGDDLISSVYIKTITICKELLLPLPATFG
jgi:hypothetical protein